MNNRKLLLTVKLKKIDSELILKLRNVIPEVVVYEEDGIFARRMDYGALTPLLVEVIKEQQ